MLTLDKEHIKPILINELSYTPIAADFFLRHYPAIHDELAPAVERWLEDRTVLDTEINGISIKHVMQIQACNFLMAIIHLNVLLNPNLTDEQRTILLRVKDTPIPRY